MHGGLSWIVGVDVTIPVSKLHCWVFKVWCNLGGGRGGGSCVYLVMRDCGCWWSL